MKKQFQNIDVQVYITDVSSLKDPILYSKCLDSIPTYRIEKLTDFKFPKDKYLSLGASALLSFALKKANYNEKELEIAYSEFGKPYFKNHPELGFNLAHSGERAICAIAVSNSPVGAEIGCDVEENSAEQAKFLLEYDMNINRWTKIESYAKATQTDLESLFYGKASITPGFIFTHPDIEPQYEYNICCRTKIPKENIHFIELNDIL